MRQNMRDRLTERDRIQFLGLRSRCCSHHVRLSFHLCLLAQEFFLFLSLHPSCHPLSCLSSHSVFIPSSVFLLVPQHSLYLSTCSHFLCPFVCVCGKILKMERVTPLMNISGRHPWPSSVSDSHSPPSQWSASVSPSFPVCEGWTDGGEWLCGGSTDSLHKDGKSDVTSLPDAHVTSRSQPRWRDRRETLKRDTLSVRHQRKRNPKENRYKSKNQKDTSKRDYYYTQNRLTKRETLETYTVRHQRDKKERHKRNTRERHQKGTYKERDPSEILERQERDRKRPMRNTRERHQKETYTVKHLRDTIETLKIHQRVSIETLQRQQRDKREIQKETLEKQQRKILKRHTQRNTSEILERFQREM